MVRFLDVPAVVGMVSRLGPVPFLAGLVDYIEADFRRWPQFEKRPRVASHSAQGVIELMPTTDDVLYAFKYVNGHPANTAVGKLTVTGVGMLADVATGYPLLVSEMTFSTALRTAATSALAARHLARADSTTMALIGLGAQAEFQALAFRAVTGVRTVRAYDIDEAAWQKFARNMAAHDLELVRVHSVDEAVEGADIVTTATADKRRAAILARPQVHPGVHLNAIGGDCPGKTELTPDILRHAQLYTEYTPQTRIEGELQQMPHDFPATELWEVITGSAPGRTSAEQVTLFDSVGFAIEDFSTLRYLLDIVQRDGGGATVDLVPALDDPRDLFGLLAS